MGRLAGLILKQNHATGRIMSCAQLFEFGMVKRLQDLRTMPVANICGAQLFAEGMNLDPICCDRIPNWNKCSSFFALGPLARFNVAINRRHSNSLSCHTYLGSTRSPFPYG